MSQNPPKSVKLPPGVGPHEGREFDLMRAGKKHVAIFFDWEPEGLEDILADGFVLLQWGEKMPAGQSYFTRLIYRPNHQIEALELRDLVTKPTIEDRSAHEHAIGAILGYTDHQVEAYLSHIAKLRAAE